MKNSFLSTAPPPLSFYHRILRVLLGIVMLIVSVIQILLLPAFLLIFAYWHKGVESGGASSDMLSAINGGALVYIASHVVWAIASLMLIFKRISPQSIWGTFCTLGGLVTYTILYSLFGNPPRDGYVILLAVVFVHACLAIGALYFSRKHRPQ